jgi:hypothetical protein
MLSRGWDRRTIVLLTFALLFVISANISQAQVFDLERDRVPLIELNGPMRFHRGDDPRWADPKFDDSGWKLLKPDQTWGASGEGDVGGMAWYRFTVHVPASLHQPVLYLPQCADSIQVFADGELIGSDGRFPPHAVIDNPLHLIFTMPNGGEGARNVVIAIRAWAVRKSDQFWSPPTARIGGRDYIDQTARLTALERYWESSGLGYLILVYLIGSGGFLLFWLRPTEREYLWFGAYELGNAIMWALVLFAHNYAVFTIPWQIAYTLAWSSKDWVCILFLAAFVKKGYNRSFLLARASIVAIAVADNLLFIPVYYGGLPANRFESSVDLSIAVLNLVLSFGLLYPLYRAARSRLPDAPYLFVAFGLFRVTDALTFVRMSSEVMGWSWLAAHLRWVNTLSTWPFAFGLRDLSELLTQLAMLAMLGLRFARSRRDEEHFKAELEAARTVQQVLIPEEIPAIPGLDLECIYKPFSQVGGDFFQILPASNHGALVVIGDVSGKGMPAAMAVSLLVGTVRTLAHYTQKPAEILTAMNQRMLGRSKDGFTTCLVIRIDHGGAVTLANAGHLAPYVGGQELQVDNGLPLGLAEGTVYTESSFRLDAGQELTLLTDGVAEARAKTGELFGFDRTASISILSAEHIAATAKAFGQQDDITVLKIRRCPVPEPTGVPLAVALGTSPAN